MFKDTVTYVDYDGVERKETLYFNLSKAEVITLDNSIPGGLGNKMRAVVDSMDNVEIMNYFVKMIELSYGKKSDDGRRFIKSKEITEDFMQTEAYSEFFMKLLSDTDFAVRFCEGILPDVPKEEVEKVRKEFESGNVITLSD